MVTLVFVAGLAKKDELGVDTGAGVDIGAGVTVMTGPTVTGACNDLS